MGFRPFAALATLLLSKGRFNEEGLECGKLLMSNQLRSLEGLFRDVEVRGIVTDLYGVDPSVDFKKLNKLS